MLKILEWFKPSSDTVCPLPVYASTVKGGFPSPADDYIEKELDLNELMIRHPAATFYVRVDGDSMIGAGIHPGDILVVDRSLKALDGKIVVAVIDGEFTVKRLRLKQRRVTLVAENSAYRDLCITDANDFRVWGVVTYVIHQPS
jgi:DNA polymerase V